MTKFSIIMPVYNNEKYFPLAVESVEKQNYNNYELIIIDDGSTDKTSQIADSLAKKNPHIKVVHQKNQWIYNSFNNGIALATGQYIYILNSDDYLIPGSLELFDRKIKLYHPDVIWTKVLDHICDAEQNIIVFDKYSNEKYFTEERFYPDKGAVRRAWPIFLTSKLTMNQANLYRREIMKNYLFRTDVYGADVLYNISIADSIKSALVLKENIYYHYIYENDNKMNAGFHKYYSYEHEMYNEIYKKYLELFQKWRLPEESYQTILCKRRMMSLTYELQNLQAPNCPLSIEEKLKYALSGCVDDIIKECVWENKKEDELESRILSGIKDLLVKESIDKSSEMYFVYELLEGFLCYEKEEEDYRKIERAIAHPLNPLHIGQYFYRQLEAKGK